MARYELRSELKDSTLCEPFASFGAKRQALRIARYIAAVTPADSDTARIVVTDAVSELAIAVFKPKEA